jgi:hypothetical protein
MGTMSMMQVNETGICATARQRKDFEGAELAEMKIVRSYSMSYYWLQKSGNTTVSRPLTVKILTPLKTVKTTFYYVNTGLKAGRRKTNAYQRSENAQRHHVLNA